MTFDLFGAPDKSETAIDRQAWLSEDGTCRWMLRQTWDATRPRALWIGHNPSDAGSKKVDDPTTHRIRFFSMAWGFGSYDLGNFYPFISPDPHFARNRAASHPELMAANRELLYSSIVKAQAVVACWGAINQDDKAISDLIALVTQHHDIMCLGTNDGGSPRHPMARGSWRVPDDQQPVLYRARQ
jgi:hypothetical protein